MNKVFWMFRIILCYFLYQNIEFFGYSIELIVTMVVIYFMPNMTFKLISSMNEVDRHTKKDGGDDHGNI